MFLVTNGFEHLLFLTVATLRRVKGDIASTSLGDISRGLFLGDGMGAGFFGANKMHVRKLRAC